MRIFAFTQSSLSLNITKRQPINMSKSEHKEDDDDDDLCLFLSPSLLYLHFGGKIYLRDQSIAYSIKIDGWNK